MIRVGFNVRVRFKVRFRFRVRVSGYKYVNQGSWRTLTRDEMALNNSRNNEKAYVYDAKCHKNWSEYKI